MFSVVTDFGLRDFLARGVSELTLPTSDYIAAGLGLLVVFAISYLGRGGVDFRDRMAAWHWPVRYAALGGILFMTLVLGAYGHGYDAMQFIYAMF